MSTAAHFPLFCASSSPPLTLTKFATFHYATSYSLLDLIKLGSFLKVRRKHVWQKQQIRSSNSMEGVPNELAAEDSKFVPLASEEPVFGPPALLLMGFEADETDKIREFLMEFDGEFLKVLHCTEEMINQSIWDAIHTEQPKLEAVKIAKNLPRICFLSGLSGEEMIMFIDAFPETGLKRAVFAALVPNSADKLLIDVAEEIMSDHEMMSARQMS